MSEVLAMRRNHPEGHPTTRLVPKVHRAVLLLALAGLSASCATISVQKVKVGDRECIVLDHDVAVESHAAEGVPYCREP